MYKCEALQMGIHYYYYSTMHEEGIKMIQKIEPVSNPETVMHVESSSDASIYTRMTAWFCHHY